MAIRVRRYDVSVHRIEWFFAGVTLFYLALIGRLVYLQAVRGEYYRDKAERKRLQTVRYPAQRGAILDREGRPLALTIHSGILVCDPTRIRNPQRTARVLAEILETQPDQILPYLQRRKRKHNQEARWVVIRRGLPDKTIAQFQQMQESKEYALDLKGVEDDDHPERIYPTGRDAAHVVGFVSPDAQGRLCGGMGIEQRLDAELRGKDGLVKAEVDAHNRIIPDTQRERIEKRDGVDVRLTIDATIQHIVETELAVCTQKYRPESATVIVMDPKTGDIQAMVSHPSFDPLNRRGLRRPFLPLMNRAISLYEPGSTMKIITVAAAMGAGVITRTTPFYCSGKLKIGRRTINCVLHGAEERYGHGTQTVRQIVEKSCNVGTAQIGIRLGMERMEQTLRAFGLLDKTQVELPGEAQGTLGFGQERLRGGAAKAARVAFGQSVAVTPLALTAAYAAIANGGVLMRPRLVQSLQDSNGKVIRDYPPVRLRVVCTPENARYLVSLLEDVVEKGTGKVAAVPGYTVAGKTGTAQKVVHNRRGYASGKYVASFIGFLPASNPRAVIGVVVDEPHGEYYGAQVAAPVFQAIAQRLMWYWKVPPDNPATLAQAKSTRR